MLRSFEERARAEELFFALSEERRFLARRDGIRAVADFAVRKIGFDGQSGDAYADVLIEAMINGADDQTLLERVRGDLSANVSEFSLEVLRNVMLRGRAQEAQPMSVPPRRYHSATRSAGPVSA